MVKIIGTLSETNEMLAMVGRSIPAGFPSPADDFLEEPINLHHHLVEHPAATFVMRVSGYSMTGAGIFDGDLITVDRSLEAKSGQIVVAVCNGEMTLKRLIIETNGAMLLKAENPDYQDIITNAENPTEIWGVVVGVVRKL